MKPEFHPLYRRFIFLKALEEADDFDEMNDCLSELIGFIENFEMGTFYAKKIRSITEESALGLITVLGDTVSESRRFQAIKEHNEEYRKQRVLPVSVFDSNF